MMPRCQSVGVINAEDTEKKTTRGISEFDVGSVRNPTKLSHTEAPVTDIFLELQLHDKTLS